MKYCTNCGKKLPDNAKFCDECGTKIITEDQADFVERKQEYAGKIRKCPSCGADIGSFTAICPECGHEINSSRISNEFKKFSDQIGDCDMKIANSRVEPKRGWKSWGKAKKIGWVILNIYTLGVPLIIYLLLPVLGIGGMSVLTSDEKKKAALIDNYQFPNDRETILELLFYIKGQMASLASGKIDRNTARWAKIWKIKAEQVFQKAEILFQGDKISNETYSSILNSEKKIKRSLLVRVIVAVVVIGAFVIFIFTRSGVGNSVKKETATFTWPSSEISEQVPEPSSNKGEIIFNDDKNFWLDVEGISDEQYEQYIKECQAVGFTIEADKDSISYKAYNELGYHIQLIHSSYDTDLTIRVEAPEKIGEIKWPQSDIAKKLPVPTSTCGRIEWEADYGFVIYIGNTTQKEYSDYVDACMNVGFTVDYKRGDDYFHAKDKNGYKVDIDYCGNNIMFVRIDEPK